jgi:hypothetical protein
MNRDTKICKHQFENPKRTRSAGRRRRSYKINIEISIKTDGRELAPIRVQGWLLWPY